jgi:MFS family permease
VHCAGSGTPPTGSRSSRDAQPSVPEAGWRTWNRDTDRVTETAKAGRVRRRPAWMTRNVVVLSWVSLLQDAASELLYPVLPIFLTAVLGAPAAVVGLVEGFAEAAASLTRLVAGRLSDRYPRRRLVGAGYGLAAVGKVLIALAYVWPVVLLGRTVDRLGKGIRGAPRDALLVDGVPLPARGRVFGLHRAADTTGAVIGPLAGLALYELVGQNIRPLLVIAVVPAVASALLVLAVHERPRPLLDRRGLLPRGVRPALAGVRRLLRPPPDTRPGFPRVAAVLIGFGVVNIPDALLLLHLSQIGFGVPAVILAYVGYNVVYALASYPAGALSDRFGPRRVYAVGLVFFALCYLGLGSTRSTVLSWLLLAAYGLFAACTDGVGKAWVSRYAGALRQGAAQGFVQGLGGFAVLVAGLWAGLAWGSVGEVPLLVAGSVAAVLAVALLTASPRRPRPRSRLTPPPPPPSS